MMTPLDHSSADALLLDLGEGATFRFCDACDHASVSPVWCPRRHLLAWATWASGEFWLYIRCRYIRPDGGIVRSDSDCVFTVVRDGGGIALRSLCVYGDGVGALPDWLRARQAGGSVRVCRIGGVCAPSPDGSLRKRLDDNLRGAFS